MIERINLIPDEMQRKTRAGQKRPLIISLLVIYVLGLGMLYFYQKGNVSGRLNNIEQAKRQRDELIAQSARYKEVIERINLAQKKEEDIKKRLAVIDSLLQGRIYWSEILRNITHLIPDGIWFASLSTYDLAKGTGNTQGEPTVGLSSNVSPIKTFGDRSVGGKGVKFNGTAISNSRIAEFVFALENSQFFGNVLLAYSQKREFHG
ncbi:MAG: PilN domain-containing protein, partial [Deltaproteobacteria bacterium]|nr:PilN domain-containing protein [Deltaproteobacteria bacterium]